MNEFETEPVYGLPEALPPGERIVWQGSPAAVALAVSAFRLRGLVVYFALLASYPLLKAWLEDAPLVTALPGVAAMFVFAAAAMAGFCLLAWLMARTAVYTITNRRVVMRIGVALSMSINIPFRAIEMAALSLNRNGTGNIALKLTGARLGYFTLWPHARPFRFRQPEPMLRAIDDAEAVAALLADALQADSKNSAPAPEAKPRVRQAQDDVQRLTAVAG